MINDYKVTLPELKKGQRVLKNHLSKSNERVTFLIVFFSIFTILLIFIKFKILDMGPLEGILVTAMGLLVILTLHERTEHIQNKHIIEEVQVYLDEKVLKLELIEKEENVTSS